MFKAQESDQKHIRTLFAVAAAVEGSEFMNADSAYWCCLSANETASGGMLVDEDTIISCCETDDIATVEPA
jgi:hypothetical protein